MLHSEVPGFQVSTYKIFGVGDTIQPIWDVEECCIMILKYFPLHPAMLPCKSVLPIDFNNETSLADGRQAEEIYYTDAIAERLNALMCLLPLPLEILPSAASTTCLNMDFSLSLHSGKRRQVKPSVARLTEQHRICSHHLI